MNIAVVDDLADDLLAAKTFLTNYLEKNFAEVLANVQIKTFSDPEDFLSDFKPEKFDLVILDIIMKPLNGIQVAQIVRNQDKEVSIIFLTTSDDFILEGYKVFAVGYFLKPLSENLDQFIKKSCLFASARAKFLFRTRIFSTSTLMNATGCKFICRTNNFLPICLTTSALTF